MARLPHSLLSYASHQEFCLVLKRNLFISFRKVSQSIFQGGLRIKTLELIPCAFILSKSSTQYTLEELSVCADTSLPET